MQVEKSEREQTHEKVIEVNGTFYWCSLSDGSVYYILKNGIEYKVIFKDGVFKSIPYQRTVWAYPKGRRQLKVLDIQKLILKISDLKALNELRNFL